ncbi:hypothetical protein NP233_g1268 [Leucocoprinus birnbaumii]|uniref:Uncharacterized protein n=1 Tax=Leucocoprinus birnbaumii TaxID=56174 RepID=A0AAD5W0M3_9AGAR|nr:hypothetical protein NP233_g1268 [Leucocoprinus birnbaumii]
MRLDFQHTLLHSLSYLPIPGFYTVILVFDALNDSESNFGGLGDAAAERGGGGERRPVGERVYEDMESARDIIKEQNAKQDRDHLPHSSGSSHHSNGDSQYYSAEFDTSASFTMNPLSSHPPRTPRTSIIANNNTAHFGTNAYDEKEVDVTDAVEESEIDEEEDRVKVAESRVRQEDVWREMFLTSYGRDKAFKIIQYSIRVYLLFHGRIATSRLWRRSQQSPIGLELVKRLTLTASGLSMTRKTLLLFNWLQPLTEIMSQQSVPFSAEQSTVKKDSRPFLQMLMYAPPPVLLELVNAIADDLATWSKLGLFGKKFGERAGRIADWCWFISTLVGLAQNAFERQVIKSQEHEGDRYGYCERADFADFMMVVEGRMYKESMTGATSKSQPKATKIDEKELARLQKQDYWLQISRAKLVMDLIFVSYELFHIKRAQDTVKAFTGLSSAILSSAKAYNRHKSSLLKAALSG